MRVITAVSATTGRLIARVAVTAASIASSVASYAAAIRPARATPIEPSALW